MVLDENSASYVGWEYAELGTPAERETEVKTCIKE